LNAVAGVPSSRGEASGMFTFGGSLTQFLDAIFTFVNLLLDTVFTSMTTVIGNLTTQLL